MIIEGDIKMHFNRGWKRFFDNIIYNITGHELLDGMKSNKRRGVYIILSVNYLLEEVDIEYIGSSKNMNNRLYHGKHDVYDKLLEKQDHVNLLIAVYYIDTNKYEEIEKLLIKSLRPRLNKQHNGQKIH
jgi:predicted GIY-YIG superfamily endonuclease